MFGTAFNIATRRGRNSSTGTSRSRSETPCAYPQSDEEQDAEPAATDEGQDAEPAAEDAAEDIHVPQRLSSFDPAHLIMIDKLRDLNVNDVIGLPQLVAVGDQGSGKSSVLEAIMEFPFPRDNGLCTRFATNIVFRRSVETSISVSIVPGKNSSANMTKIKDFERDGLEKLDGPTFLDILNKASDAMGIIGRNETRTSDNKAFSDDVLKIVIRGPDRENLSIVDVPGIFRISTPGETTENDIKLVEDMVRTYIKDERTIILAVVQANVDISTHGILGMAKKVDPAGERTLAVLTKPDGVDKGAEPKIIDLVNGHSNKLNLGYCIVRNRGQDELDSTTVERNTKELEFFKSAPWNALDTDRVGVQSLKSRLQRLLAENIQNEFPKIRNDIEKRLQETRVLLSDLGSERKSPEQQRRFLDDIASKFQAIKNFSMDNMYDRHTILENGTDFRLPTLFAEACDHLESNFRARGTTVPFDDSDELDSEPTSPLASFSGGSGQQSSLGSQTQPKAAARPSAAKGLTTIYPELANLSVYRGYDHPTRTTIPSSAHSWIESEYQSARAYTVSAMDLSILPLLWRTQSQNWPGIAREFLQEVIGMVHRFILDLLEKVCSNTRTRTCLKTFLLDEMIKRYNGAIDSVCHILTIECSGNLITRNPNFVDTLSRCRSRNNVADPQKPQKRVDITEQIKSPTSHSGTPFAVDDLHDVLCAYHKVARKRIIDNIIQNVDYFLLRGEQSPLNILTTGFVSGLTVRQLERCAGESELRRLNRERHETLIVNLEKAMDVIMGM